MSLITNIKPYGRIRQAFCTGGNGKSNIATVVFVAACAFVAGLSLPSPFFDGAAVMKYDGEQLTDTAGMRLPDGSVYEGTVIADTKERQGYGRLTTRGGAAYEGNWQKGLLPYGTRTTATSTYRGCFDREMNHDGFGIITYSDSYVSGKGRQGLADSQITVTYAGNWRKNIKEGLGRSLKKDGSMEFGVYHNGLLQPVAGEEYSVGGKVYGIDVSHYQGDIDWANLALYCDSRGNVYPGRPESRKYMQPVFFVYIKATEGATVQDETFSVRSREAEKHGIVKGAYHFLQLGSDVDDQVRNFLETATWTKGDLPPALDVEVDVQAAVYGRKRLVDMTFGWLEAVEKRLGVRPIIYTRESIRDKYLIDDPRFGKYQCWISRYHPAGPDSSDWKIWQLTERGVAGGHDGYIDIDMFKGDYAAFRKFVGR